MKKTFKQIGIICALGIGISTVGYSAEKSKWEIWTGSMAKVSSISMGGVSNTLIDFIGNRDSALTPSIGYNFADNMEVKLSPSFFNVSSGGTALTNWGLLAGLNYSFMGNTMADSMFIDAGVGLSSTSVSNVTTTSFRWQVGLGKRFSIAQNVTWTPEINYAMINVSPTATTFFEVIPVQFTFFL